jgi:predicted murein hydrolase (TIGR00659 family)
MTAIVCVIVTIGSYLMVKKFYRKWPYVVFQPILLCPVALIAFLKYSHIPYQTFHQGTQFLSDLLGPATVAFAIPLYKNFDTFKKYLVELTSSVFAGTCVAILSSFVLATRFHFNPSIVYSMVPRSVTTPIAMDISQSLGGDPTISAVFVIMTALVGISVGPVLIRFFKTPIAKGALFGTSCHGAGTSKAFELGSLEGTFSSISMIVAAIISLVIAPVAVPLFERL